MLTKYIELYYQEMSLFVISSQNYASAAVGAVTIAPTISTINQATSHVNSFSAPSNPTIVVYEYDQESTPSFTNKLITCSTSNKCVYFGYPVNWIIEYPASVFAATVTSSVALTNGKYAGTFAGTARAFSASLLTIFKGTFQTTYTPSALGSSYFYTSYTSINRG